TVTETVSLILKVRNAEQLDEFIAASVDPESGRYHQFLSVGQFRDRYAPTKRQIKRVTDYLTSLGIVVNEVYDNHLVIKATGTAAQFNQAFTTTLHDYEDKDGKVFQKPEGDHGVPEMLQDVVLYVAGLNTQSAQYRPHNTNARVSRAALGEAPPKVVLPSGNSTATGIPGSYTTGDVANFYGVNPLYAQGITGKGRTIGIATLANFLPADAYNYWSQIGLNVDPNRIRQVHVDGGGPLSGAAGSGETSLDVEQSGGLAPDAKVVVYDAPNTEAGFIDVFYKAVADNAVDTLSVSWGSPEIFNFLIPGVSTDTQAVLVAYHQAFAEAAAQGISTFAAAGDSGAYDTNSSLPYPQFSKILTVDSPASDPYIIAAGGTTLPGNIQRKYGVVFVPTEQVWGWDYFNPYLVTNYGPAYQDYYFSVGGGGGVSVFWSRPDYQKETRGIRKSEPNQVWTYYPNFPDTSVQAYLYTVAPNVAGRNLPDVSLNSDPYTGYLIYSSPDGGWLAGYGGTSFASPQLNGIFALIGQTKSSRLGLLNPQLYTAAAQRDNEEKSGLIDIRAGDNWFYAGVKGYEPGAGLGTINAAAVARTLR
ncbi:MAG: S8/S53 family peptidase, partial [Burkholderiales bacterium]|nr:S8/S53 family peptidase [Burkholderiales bacterium]